MKREGWTLFLDRDGVINRRLPGAYVRRPEDFEFLPAVPETLALLRRYFERIIVLTNQQGIGKGLMKEADLETVHEFMRYGIGRAGGRLDGIYYCPHLAGEGCSCRKPRTGMALQAKTDFPDIEFSRSVLVGDSASDILLGLRLGMRSIWMRQPDDPRSMPHPVHAILDAFADLPALMDQRKITSVAPKP